MLVLQRVGLSCGSARDGWHSVHGNRLPGDEGVGPRLYHPPGVVGHERRGLDVEVSEHFVRLPTADESNDVRVDLREEEGVRPRRA